MNFESEFHCPYCTAKITLSDTGPVIREIEDSLIDFLEELDDTDVVRTLEFINERLNSLLEKMNILESRVDVLEYYERISDGSGVEERVR